MIYQNMLVSLLGKILYFFVIAINKTIRISLTNNSGKQLFEKDNYIYAIWHQNTFTPFYLYRNKNIAMFVSKNLSGKVLGYAAVKLGYQPIALQDDSARSLVLLHKKIEGGDNTIMAVDGPRGPAGQIKEGTQYLSLKDNKPTLGVKVSYSFCIPLIFRWDKYRVPLPFSKVSITFSNLYDEDSDWEGLIHDI